MTYIFTVYLLITIILIFVDLKAGVSAFIIYSFLVPLDLPFFFMSSNNMVQLCMLASLLLYSQKHKTQENLGSILKPFAPLIVLYFLYFAFSLFGDGSPFGYCAKTWQMHIRKYFLLSIIMWYVSKTDIKAIVWFNNAFLFSGIAILVYGIFLLFTNGINPYITFLAATFDASEWGNIVNERDTSRYMYRIASFFLHPMNYGLFLCLFVVFLYSIRKKLDKYVFFVLMTLCIICLFTNGIRTSIFSFVFGIILYLMFLRRVRISLLFLFWGGVGYYIVSAIPEINDTIESLFNSNKEIGGSSFDVRIDQFKGCFNEIRTCFVFGKGYEWTQFYMNKHGNHPTMLAFESVIIKVLCNSGVAGIISYIFCFYKFTKNTSKIVNSVDSKALGYTLVAVFIIYCVATGDYGYLSLFMPFYSLFIINHCVK